MTAPEFTPVFSEWRRLSPRMLLVHPVHEVLRQLPLLIGSLVLGQATGNPLWSLLGLAMIIAFGVARWFTTTYRIDSEEVQLRSGLLQRNALSLPRNRIRSVQTDARLLHRLLGLTVLRVSTGQDTKGAQAFELDAVEAGQVPRLRSILLAGSVIEGGATNGGATNRAADDAATPGAPTSQEGQVLARWQPSWLRYSPLSLSGLLMILGAVALAYQAGLGAALRRSDLAESGRDAAERFGVAATVSTVVVVLVIASVVLAVARSLLTYGNLVLTRREGTSGVGESGAGVSGGVLHLEHGLLRRREHTYDMRRLRGGTLRQSLLVRALGGARLDAVMTGVDGSGESSLLLPPCPASTADAVLTGLVGNPAIVSGALIPHGPAAARRRWSRGLTLPVVLGVVLVVLELTAGVRWWLWPVLAVLTACCALLAADRVRALGHRVGDGWLVTRSGSVERRRDCIETDGIIGWTVRQTFFQRRAGVATLVAATAAGTKSYRVVDVPAQEAWVIAATASPWVATSQWARAQL